MPSVSNLDEVNFVSASHRESFLFLSADRSWNKFRMTFRDAVSHLLVSEGLLALAFGRLEDGELNSRGFSNPWKAGRFNYRTVCKDGDFNTEVLSSPRPRCRSASSQTPFLLLFCFHGLESPRLFAFGFASCQTPCFVRHIWRLGGFDLCIVFNVLFLVCISLLRQWPMANS